jgi:hypothetical protein
MRFRLVTVLVALFITRAFADEQTVLIARLRNHPTEDFSRQSEEKIRVFAEADAMVYFRDHKNVNLNLINGMALGSVHALKHKLTDYSVIDYSRQFAVTLEILEAKE